MEISDKKLIFMIAKMHKCLHGEIAGARVHKLYFYIIVASNNVVPGLKQNSKL